jgi:hypothetical protein
MDLPTITGFLPCSSEVFQSRGQSTGQTGQMNRKKCKDPQRPNGEEHRP